jgi:hypothetical protein
MLSKYIPEDYSRTLSSSTSWKKGDGTTAPKPMTRCERLTKIKGGDHLNHLSPFAKALSQMYVEQGLAECSAAFAAHEHAFAAVAVLEESACAAALASDRAAIDVAAKAAASCAAAVASDRAAC